MRSHQFSERISQFSIRSIISDFQCFGVRDWLSNLHPIASTVIAINSRMRNLLTSPFNRVLSLQDFIITIGIIDTIGITVNVFMDIFFKFDSCNSLDNLIMR